MAEVLLTWLCSGCGGKGTYQQDARGRANKEARGIEPDPHYQPNAVTCKRCGGHRLEPAARRVLIEAGIINPSTGES
jgi:hypothetical protein